MKLSRTLPVVRALLTATFPEYNGRKISAEIAEKYYVNNMWDGGSRSECIAVDLTTGRAAQAVIGSFGTNVPIPSGVVIVEHSIFCGQDAGITIYVSAQDAVRFLQQEEGQVQRFLPAA